MKFAAGTLDDRPKGDVTVFAMVAEVLADTDGSAISFTGSDRGETMVTYAGRSILGGYADAAIETNDCETCPDENGIAIYPNPTRDRLTVQLPVDADGITITPMSTNGRILEVRRLNQPSAILDLSEQPAGVYLLQVETDGEKRAYRVVKY